MIKVLSLCALAQFKAPESSSPALSVIIEITKEIKIRL
jgi:hypothetical protein